MQLVNIFNYYQTQDNGIMVHLLIHISNAHLVLLPQPSCLFRELIMQYMVKLDIVSVENLTNIICVPLAFRKKREHTFVHFVPACFVNVNAVMISG